MGVAQQSFAITYQRFPRPAEKYTVARKIPKDHLRKEKWYDLSASLRTLDIWDEVLSLPRQVNTAVGYLCI